MECGAGAGTDAYAPLARCAGGVAVSRVRPRPKGHARVRRHLLTAGLALATALALPGTAHATTPAEAAGYGAGYLGRLMDPTGYVPALSGPDHGTTASAVLALVAAGAGEAQAAAATAYLMADVDAFAVDGGGDDKPAALASLILVAHARGLDPSALVTRLLATKRTTGNDAGLFGEQDATYDGAYRQALALLALKAAGTTDADAVAWLKAEQCDDGGWMGDNPDPSAPCPSFDFDTFVGEDTNGTALAAQALVALGETPDHDPLAFLATARNTDGGYGFVPGFASDANSTALAAQALIAGGADASGAQAFLLTLQLGNPPATTAGAFAFQAGQGANAFATAQAVPALAGKAFPIAPATLAATLPLLPAPAAPATPSPAATPAPVAVPTRLVDPAPVRTLPDTGIGEQPWDATGQVVFGLGLVGYGVLALGAARLLGRRRG